jgi:hypothetical protein
VKKVLRDNGLGIGFGVLFLLALLAQSVAGWQELNAQQAAQGLGELSWWRYVVSADFAVDVVENWQSEFLQFFLYLMATVWVVQRGSPESKEMDEEGTESDRDQKVGRYAADDSPAWARARGWPLRLYSHSLCYVMGLIFVLCWLVQSIAGCASYNEDRLRSLQDPISWTAYLRSPDFWSRTLQNWQSEFLAIGAMAVLAVFLRQRGSSQSKPVGASHAATGADG